MRGTLGRDLILYTNEIDVNDDVDVLLMTSGPGRAPIFFSTRPCALVPLRYLVT